MWQYFIQVGSQLVGKYIQSLMQAPSQGIMESQIDVLSAIAKTFHQEI